MKFDKGTITMSISILIMCILLVSVMCIQFKTVEQVNETDIENMREAELREQISTWKSKYEEVNEKLTETNSKIEEYNAKIESNDEASELLDEELKKSNLLLGTTNVVGEGVVVTLTDNQERQIQADNLVELINELRFWRLDTLPFIPSDWKYEIIPQVENQFNIVKGLMQREDIEEIYNAGDSGRTVKIVDRCHYIIQRVR